MCVWTGFVGTFTSWTWAAGSGCSPSITVQAALVIKSVGSLYQWQLEIVTAGIGVTPCLVARYLGPTFSGTIDCAVQLNMSLSLIGPCNTCANWPATLTIYPDTASCLGSGSSGTGSGGGIVGTGEGNGQSTTPTTSLTLPNIPSADNSILQVWVFAVGGIGNVGSINATYTPGGGESIVANPSINAAGLEGLLALINFKVITGATADVVITTTHPTMILAQVINVTGLASNLDDDHQSANGLASAPNTGATAGATGTNDWATAGMGMIVPSGSPSYTWAGGFTNTGQDVSGLDGTVQIVLTVGGQVIANGVSVTGSLSGGITASGWTAIVETMK